MYNKVKTPKLKTPCNISEKELSIYSIKAHLATQHGIGNAFQCDHCYDELFSSKKRLECHMKTKHEKNVEELFMCDECGKSFVSKEYLDHHKRIKHSITGKHNCTKCSKTF